MTTLSTHVLDAAAGAPASGLALTLHEAHGELLATATTDAEGRVRFDLEVSPGTHRLVFETGPWFAGQDRETFYPEVTVAFEVAAGQDHYHVALLLSPFAYTTYRGS
jgi:5-hydroxyisourate hydrolase